MTPDLESAAPLPHLVANQYLGAHASRFLAIKINWGCTQCTLGMLHQDAPGGFNVSERSLDVADKHPRLSEAGMEPKICLQLFTPPGNTIGCSPATIAQRPSYRTIALAGRDLE